VNLVVDERAVAGAVVSLKARRSENPVPAELGEVDGERIATTALLGCRLVAVQVRRQR